MTPFKPTQFYMLNIQSVMFPVSQNIWCEFLSSKCRWILEKQMERKPWRCNLTSWKDFHFRFDLSEYGEKQLLSTATIFVAYVFFFSIWEKVQLMEKGHCDEKVFFSSEKRGTISIHFHLFFFWIFRNKCWEWKTKISSCVECEGTKARRRQYWSNLVPFHLSLATFDCKVFQSIH